MNSPTEPAPSPSSAAGEARRPVVVIGGGVIGAACAHELAQAGASVLLIEQGEFGKGCSHGNCGYVSPSHILPLCRPGAIQGALQSMLQRDAPFQIRPRLDWGLWSWLLRFARRCNRIDMLQAGHARQALLDSSRALYASLIESGMLTDCEWETRGLLFVHQSRSHFEHYAETDELLRKEFGLGAKRLEEAELLALEPALKPGIAGAWLYECDAHLRPDKLMTAWRRRLEQDGVAVREQCQFHGLEISQGAISALRTSGGTIAVDQVVFATGAWTRQLQNQLHIPIPIEPGKGYSITMPRPALCPTYPMVFEEHRVAITPMASGYRIGSTMEFAGFDRSLRPERLNILINGAKRYLHEPLAEPFLETWYGWRPMSCDGVPLIGRIPRLSNAWLAAGHSMLGVSMATGTGKLMAELMTGRHPHVDPHPYRVDRF